MNYHRSLEIKAKIQPASRILSVGTYLPKNIVLSDHLFEEIKSDKQYGIPTNWMSEQMGIVERRVSEPSLKPSDLAIPAAREAIESCDSLNPDQIDMVIFCGIERDHPEPATAHTIQNKLGLKANHAFDIANACFGFNDGIETADNFIKAGAARYVLVVTGEIPTRLIPSFVRQLKAGVEARLARNLIGWLSVGDAGGAVIIGPSVAGDRRGFHVFKNNVDSSHVDKCQYELGTDGEYHGEMKMAKIVAHGYRLHRQIIAKTMNSVGWKKFDFLLTHQTGKKNFNQIAGLGIVEPQNMVRTYDYLGNITSATLPVSYKLLSENGRVQPGSRIGGCFGGSGLTTGQFCYTF